MLDKCECNGCHGCMICMKVAVAALVIIILKLWGGAMNWVIDTNIWWFVLILAVLVLCPLACRCKKSSKATTTGQKTAAVSKKKR